MTDAGMIYKHFKSEFPEPKDGDLRIWWVPQIPGKEFEWPVANLEQAALLLDALSAYDDFQYWQHIKPDHSNMGGLCVYRSGHWHEWESDDCDDFDAWRDEQRAKKAA